MCHPEKLLPLGLQILRDFFLERYFSLQIIREVFSQSRKGFMIEHRQWVCAVERVACLRYWSLADSSMSAGATGSTASWLSCVHGSAKQTFSSIRSYCTFITLGLSPPPSPYICTQTHGPTFYWLNISTRNDKNKRITRKRSWECTSVLAVIEDTSTLIDRHRPGDRRNISLLTRRFMHPNRLRHYGATKMCFELLIH